MTATPATIGARLAMTALRPALITLVGAVVGVGLGLLASIGGSDLGLLLSAVSGALLIGIALRRALRLHQAGPAASDAATRRAASSRHAPTLARLCFYAGSLTITFSTARPMGLTVSEAFFAVAVAGGVFDVLRGRAIAPVPMALLLGAFVFAVGGAVSSLGSHNLPGSLRQTAHGVYVMLLWVWSGGMILRTSRDRRIVVELWVLSAAINGVSAIAQLSGIHLLVGAPLGNRMTGFTSHPNDLGGGAAVTLVPAVALTADAFARGARRRGVLASFAVGMILVAVLLSGSLAAFGGALLAMIVWLASPAVRTQTRIAIAGVAVVVLVGATIAGGSISPVQRLNEVTSSSVATPGGGSGEARLDIARSVWPRIVENPVVGVGLDVQDSLVPTIAQNGVPTQSQIHGLPLAIWYEGGIFALIGLLLVFVGLLRATVATAGGEGHLLGWAISAAMVASIVYLMSAPADFQQYGWMPAVVLVAWWVHHPRAVAIQRWLVAPGLQ